MRDDVLAGTHGGMSDEDQPPVPLTTTILSVQVITSAAVEWTDELLEAIATAVWQQLPVAEDGDVFVRRTS